jgi:hypothetical protein
MFKNYAPRPAVKPDCHKFLSHTVLSFSSPFAIDV